MPGTKKSIPVYGFPGHTLGGNLQVSWFFHLVRVGDEKGALAANALEQNKLPPKNIDQPHTGDLQNLLHMDFRHLAYYPWFTTICN